jgi:AcrR family transcriptional regulator
VRQALEKSAERSEAGSEAGSDTGSEAGVGAGTPAGIGRTRPTREQTRARILAAAIAVFGERGIAATSVSEVAAAAGMTKGAVYSSFTGKDELVLAMMEEHVHQRLSSSLESFEHNLDPAAAIAEIGRVMIDAIRADAVWHRLLAEYFALAQHDPTLRAALQDRRREARNAIARALDRLADNLGVGLPLPADELALVLIALSNGLGIESGIDPDAVSDDLIGRVLAILVRDFIQALQAKAR